MCDPMTMAAVTVGTAAASGGLSIYGAGQKEAGRQAQMNYDLQQTMEYNRRVQDNAMRANVAAGNQYSALQQRRYFNAQDLVQRANDATNKAREAGGVVNASAFSSGFMGGGSVRDIYNKYLTKEANIAANTSTKFRDMESAYNEQGKSIYAQAEDRINGMPVRSAPLAPMSTYGLDIANALVDTVGSATKGVESSKAFSKG